MTSAIQWTDETWNPVRGCTRVSEGCRNCYAERRAARFSGPKMPFEGFAESTTGGPRWTGAVKLIPEKLEEPLHWRKPRRVFVNSMSDLFHERLTNEEIAAVLGVMAACPHLTFQVLTKRPERMLEWFEWLEQEHSGGAVTRGRKISLAIHRAIRGRAPGGARVENSCNENWPLQNVWLGVSVEDQATADERIPLLLQTPAAVHFVSYEPALGPVDFSARWLFNSAIRRAVAHAIRGDSKAAENDVDDFFKGRGARVDWLIYGGESGPRARPNDLAWARSARDQCDMAGVKFFMKQLGSAPFTSGSAEPYFPCTAEQDYGEMRQFFLCGMQDSKGGDPREWPQDLRRREFPTVNNEKRGGVTEGVARGSGEVNLPRSSEPAGSNPAPAVDRGDAR